MKLCRMSDPPCDDDQLRGSNLNTDTHWRLPSLIFSSMHPQAYSGNLRVSAMFLYFLTLQQHFACLSFFRCSTTSLVRAAVAGQQEAIFVQGRWKQRNFGRQKESWALTTVIYVAHIWKLPCHDQCSQISACLTTLNFQAGH